VKLILEPGDLPGGVEPLKDDSDVYGWWTKIVCRPGGDAFAVLAYRGGGHTIEADQIEVVFEAPPDPKPNPKRRRRRPARAAA
jgi:hypothetical protein